jgi:Putative transmembrane protein (PGPGW)
MSSWRSFRARSSSAEFHPCRLYRLAFGVAGTAVLLAGLAMLVLPGSGLLATDTGPAMLALEFAWADRLLSGVTERLYRARLLAARGGSSRRR